MSTAGRPRDNPNAASYLGVMLGTFIGFWAVLPRLASGVLTEVLAPVAVVLAVVALGALLRPRARRVWLGTAIGLVTGTTLALVIGVALVATTP